jgi:hypothetical protein
MLEVNQYVKVKGMPVKNDNDIYTVKSDYGNNSYCLYKVKLNGEEAKTKYSILFLKDKDFNNSSLDIKALNGIEDLKRAKKEINNYLKGIEENEVVISFADSDKKEIEKGDYIKVIKPISTTKSIYSIPTGFIYFVAATPEKNTRNYLIKRVGKTGHILRSEETLNIINFKESAILELLQDGYITIVQKEETTKAEKQLEEQKTELEAVQDIATEETEQEEQNTNNNEQTDNNSESNELPQNEATYTLNHDKNGIEISFNDKPDQQVLEALKAHSFRWHRVKKVWYAKQSEERITLAQQLTGQQEGNNSNTSESQAQTEVYSYPEIDINDIDQYTVSEQLQKREHDSNWIFRKNERDRTKEIQDHFSYYNNKVLDILKDTDNQTIIYYLKRALQSYKKNYYNNFIKQLENRANNPSWAVTGRAGRNVSRAEKANNRYDNLMREAIELDEKIKKDINRANRDIRKDKENAIREQMNQTNVDITFTTETKEINSLGVKWNVRTYNYKNYMIAKVWNSYHIFKDGKDIHNLKTTEKLDQAKKYVSMLVQQEQQEKELQAV